jgi:hypothetical protein
MKVKGDHRISSYTTSLQTALSGQEIGQQNGTATVENSLVLPQKPSTKCKG